MNEIIVKTNRSEYSGGSNVYGVVYLKLLDPVVADTVTICISGRESCKWSQTVPNLAGLSRSRSSSELSTDTGFCDLPTSAEGNTAELHDVVLTGEHNNLNDELSLVEFKGNVIPLGCYAFPFQYTLKHGLPNSFKREPTKDEIKNCTYEAEISYIITATLKYSLTASESELKCSHEIKLRNEDFMKKKDSEFTKVVKKTLKTCFCFPKGEISLNVCLSKLLYTLGETINVRFNVENKTNVQISTGRVKLSKTMNLRGKRIENGDKVYEGNESFPESEKFVVPLQMQSCNKMSFEVPIHLKKTEKELLTSTIGTLVKCRYDLEVELDVPLDEDISVIFPIRIYPHATESLSQWSPPAWIKDVKVHEVNEFFAVPRYILEATEFAHILLPLAGLQT